VHKSTHFSCKLYQFCLLQSPVKLANSTNPECAVYKPRKAKLHRWSVFGILVFASALIGCLSGLALVYLVRLPADLEHYRPISNTELYDDHGRVIGTFALQRRVVAAYDDYPKVLRDAVISIEDKDFDNHSGVELWRIVSAAYHDLLSGANVEGASTLTMQLARNLFLSPERTYSRKLQELLLAIQIERRLTKPQIFTLYANQIYLGHGVYGFESAAEFYFSKPAKDLRLEEAALLAALPKAPNNYSPIRNPERAMRRRNHVLNAMFVAGKITSLQAEEAKKAPISLIIARDSNSLAPYFVEQVRLYLEKKYSQEQVYEGGLKVYTSLDFDLQRSATQAVLDGLAKYERRHGWRTKLLNVRELGVTVDTYRDRIGPEIIEPATYVHALVTAVSAVTAAVRFGQYTATIDASEVTWTGHSLRELFSVGDIAYVKVLSVTKDNKVRVRLEEDSGTQGALVAIDNRTGDIKAMVGGRDFDASKFNRATQALRQVGSSFKPYVYTAAIDQGATPEDTVLDAPVTFMTASGAYTPHNYDETFKGIVTLRDALAESRNIPALKLAESVGVQTVIDYAHRFGISEHIPAYLPIALGAVELTLLEHTSAFSVFPDDGIRLIPRYVVKVTDSEGHILENNYSAAHDVISERTARVMTSMLREVVLHGTAAAASHMKFVVAGKTGTTNDFTDAWFLGFSRSLTCGVWIGFDDRKSLGKKETGALAALPVWMSFMELALGQDDRREFSVPTAPQPHVVARQTARPFLLPADRGIF